MLFQHTSPVECRSCVVYAQNSILCQFGNLEICPNFTNPYLTQFSSISGGNCIKLITQQLLENKYDQPVEESPSKRPRHGTTEHCLVSLPTGKQFVQGRLATCRSKYQTWKCSCKLAHVRTYCQCTPGVLHCSECYAEHVADAAVDDLLGT